jgi:hypothetical protein
MPDFDSVAGLAFRWMPESFPRVKFVQVNRIEFKVNRQAAAMGRVEQLGFPPQQGGGVDPNRPCPSNRANPNMPSG